MLSFLWPRFHVLYLIHLSAVVVVSSALIPRNTSSTPDPIVYNPDHEWDGLDGSWSTFTLQIGTPEQTVHVLPSWQSYQTWAVLPEGCSAFLDYDACADARGGIFNLSQSTTWDEVGTFLLWIERNLDYTGNAYYGYDVVGLGDTGTTLPNTTVGAFAVSDFWLGIFGLNPKPTNWTDYNNPAPSYMALLKDKNLIPSISFGYTAGASYRSSSSVASLTLGGYDQSRFEVNDVEFGFAPDDERDTVVAIQTITTQDQNSSSSVDLLPDPIYAFIDSTVSQIWLPLEACQEFEREFGLTYDNTTELYLVNDSLHNDLVSRNPQLNFTLGQMTTGGHNVTISFPYSAFDLTAISPYQGLASDTRYFPLKRAANDTQYTLGRTFMQEAFITVDYERAKFSVSQCLWTNTTQNITAIQPPPVNQGSGYSGTSTTSSSTPSSGSSSSSSHLSGGAIGGIVAGSVLGICTLIALFTLYLRRKRTSQAPSTATESGTSSRDSNSITATHVGIAGEKGESTLVYPKHELEASTTYTDVDKGYFAPPSTVGSPTIAFTGTWSSSDAAPLSPTGASEVGGAEIFEMAGDMPELAMKDGRQISEKEMMQRREEMYNGVAPLDEVVSPVVEGHERRIVAPEHVVLQNEVRKEEGSNERFSFESS